MLEQLGLCNTRISHQQCIDLPSDPHSVFHLFVDAANHEKQESLLDLLHRENFGADGGGDLEEKSLFRLGIVFQFHHFFHHVLRKHVFFEILLILSNFVSLDVGILHQSRLHRRESGVWGWQVDACNRHNITRTALSGYRASGDD